MAIYACKAQEMGEQKSSSGNFEKGHTQSSDTLKSISHWLDHPYFIG
jgi:hypothetical protein